MEPTNCCVSQLCVSVLGKKRIIFKPNGKINVYSIVLLYDVVG